ncbi:DNA polymerase Y family protein [Amycolatopsis panacis]|nr:DNA polymerase Y family protein [Amycolatopsis panacis]
MTVRNEPARMLVVWCPDWPAVAAIAVAGAAPAGPAAVFSANRVVACTEAARAGGVRRGLRRREAESRCPGLAVFAADDGRDARLFENVAQAVEDLVVGLEVVRPGLLAVPVAGAAGYYGGEHRIAERLLDRVAADAGVECQIGVSEGLFAAILAARRGVFVEPGQAAEFLATLPITELDQPGADRAELVGLLVRLGLRTLGAFAALGERDVTARFGRDGVLAHRLARGRSDRPPLRRRPPPELSLTEVFDPPLARVDVAAFLAKSLGARFHATLAARGLACTRLGVYATTERGEQLGRVWRCAEPLTPQGVADRVRWQFEGWLQAAPGARPSAGVTRLQLVPEETVEGRSLQLGLWRGGDPASGADTDEAAERAGRAFARVQGLLGPEGVCTPLFDGGRDPAARIRLVPWGDSREPVTPPEATWPGRLPSPSPATVLDPPLPVQVEDEQGRPVGCTSRKRLTAPPHRLRVAGGPPRRITAWAGPWPVTSGRRATGPHQARLQLLLGGEGDAPGEAVLALCSGTESPQWMVEGWYD